MSVIVNPIAGMVPVYPYYLAQDYYYRVLTALRDVQNTIQPAYTFDVVKNKSETYVADNTKKGLVNCMIGDVDSKQATPHSKEHDTKLLFKLYWKSKDDNQSGLKADELALEYLYYLGAVVEFGLTAVYNQIPDNIDYGNFKIGELRTRYSEPAKIGESDSVWGLGQIELDIQTAYTYDDITLNNLEELTANLGNNINPLFTPNPAP